MASLKEIAGELGISHTLVSKVLSGRMGTTGASAITREAILRKAKELNYTPNRLAVALKSGRKHAVAVFMHSMGTPGSGLSHSFLKSIAAGLGSSGIRVWLRFFEDDDEFLKSYDEELQRDVDGLIVAGVEHPHLVSRLREIDEGGLPVVCSFASAPSAALSSYVSIDNEMQSYLPTKHLLENGCRRLAHFKVLESRYAGFVRAHREVGIPVAQELVIPTLVFTLESGMECTAALLHAGPAFDGIVAQSDAQAVGAVRVLTERRIRVPDDVKLTGIDNSPLAEACFVPLTSATNQTDECGRIAVELMLKRIAGETVEPVMLRPRLVVRKSSGIVG